MSEQLCCECLKKAVIDFDTASSDAEFESPHPIFRLAEHNDNLTRETVSLKTKLKEAEDKLEGVLEAFETILAHLDEPLTIKIFANAAIRLIKEHQS